MKQIVFDFLFKEEERVFGGTYTLERVKP